MVASDHASDLPWTPRHAVFACPTILLYSHSAKRCMERNWGSHHGNASLRAADSLVTIVSLLRQLNLNTTNLLKLTFLSRAEFGWPCCSWPWWCPACCMPQGKALCWWLQHYRWGGCRETQQLLSPPSVYWSHPQGRLHLCKGKLYRNLSVVPSYSHMSSKYLIDIRGVNTFLQSVC